MTPVLEINNLVKNYGSFCAVKDVSLKIQEGEVLGLLGPNGAGKSTLINSIVTLEDFQKGEIRICGNNLKEETRLCKSLTGYMPQEVIHHGYFKLEEVLRYHAGYYGYFRNRESHIQDLMKKLSLWEHRNKKIIQLSGGMKRRLLFAKSLVHDPKLLLLDEPTTGVDIQLREDIWDFVRQLKKKNRAILLTTHYLEEAEKLCDRVILIHQGQLRRQNQTKRLIQEFTLRKVLIFLKDEYKVNHKYLKINTGKYLEFHIPFSVDMGQIMMECQLSWNQIQDIQVQEGSLEDVFKDMLGEKI